LNWHSLSDSGSPGSPQFVEVAKGEAFSKSLLKSDDVFILDTKATLFVWVGSGASRSEKGLALKVAIQYLNDKGRPADLAVTRFREGNENADFLAIFSK
jgi:gelsolin